MTTRSTTIEGVWQTAIWDSAEIQRITDKIYTSNNSQLSEFEISKYYSDEQEINAIVWQVTRSEKYLGINVLQEKFIVEVTYYRTIDLEGANWGYVRDFFELLTQSVKTNLSYTWTNTISYWESQEEPATITEDSIGDQPVWVGKFSFTGYI
jgi:hypothetical protein